MCLEWLIWGDEEKGIENMGKGKHTEIKGGTTMISTEDGTELDRKRPHYGPIKTIATNWDRMAPAQLIWT